MKWNFVCYYDKFDRQERTVIGTDIYISDVEANSEEEAKEIFNMEANSYMEKNASLKHFLIMRSEPHTYK